MVVNPQEVFEYMQGVQVPAGAGVGPLGPLGPFGATMDFWVWFIYASAFMALVARMKAQGLTGTIRTRVIATTPDNVEQEFPFVNITI